MDNTKMETDGRILLLRREGKILTLLFGNGRLLRAGAYDPAMDVLGNIYVGKVKNVVPGIQAAFVEFLPGMLCFLPLKESAAPILTNRSYDGRIIAGDEIVLQITSESQKNKEAGASTNLSFPGKYVVLTFGRKRIGYSPKLSHEQKNRLRRYVADSQVFTEITGDYGVIFRTNAENLTDFSILEKELAALRSQADGLRTFSIHRTCFSLLRQSPPAYLKNLQDTYETAYEKILTDDAVIYEEVKAYMEEHQPEDIKKLCFYEDSMLSLDKLYSVEARLQEALDRKVWLKSGAYLVIEPTEALISIDVNSGKFTGKKRSSETYFRINLEAAQEIAHQLVLRNLSGMILIDFINMESDEQKKELLLALRKALLKDPQKAAVVDMTALGLVEVTRKKEKKSLWEQLRSPYEAYQAGKGQEWKVSEKL